MSEGAPPERITVFRSPEARADVRAIDRDKAMQILYCLDRYLGGRNGDVKRLKAPLTGFRLRCGDYRVSSIKGRKTLSRLPAFGIGVKPIGRAKRGR